MIVDGTDRIDGEKAVVDADVENGADDGDGVDGTATEGLLRPRELSFLLGLRSFRFLVN